MSDAKVDPEWPRVLSLTVHELRTPMTVVAGYIRMLLKDRAGPLSDQQRRLLEEAEKSCGRLSVLVAEISELGHLEGGTAAFNRQPADLHQVLRNVVENLPPLPDREVPVELRLEPGPAPIEADASRLAQALSSIVKALRRELVDAAPLIVRQQPSGGDAGGYEIQIGDEPTLAALEAEDPAGRAAFDEWRGGCGLILPAARRIIEAHGGRLWGAPDGRKSGARVTLST